jgi:N-acetylmuramoyl-L-alanine amidase
MHSRSFSRLMRVALFSSIFVALGLGGVYFAPIAARAQISTATLAVCFVANGQTTCVDRPAPAAPQSITGEVSLLTQWLIAGPTAGEKAAGAQSALPQGTQLDGVTVTQQQAAINLIMSDSALQALTDQQVEDINEQFRTTLTPYNFLRLDLNAQNSAGIYQPLSKFLKSIKIPRKPLSPTTASLQLTGESQGGGLRGKTVFVSAGHGWYWHNTLNSFKTQRPIYPLAPYPAGEGTIEDFNNAEAVNQYLLQYLEKAGADSWTVRERDLNTNMIIVDDNDPGFSTDGTWSNNSGGYNGTYRSTETVNAAPTAAAAWTFVPPLTATYAVYVRFPSSSVTRTVDARYFVEHAGAVTPVTITQARDGNNWRFIGQYPFYGGQPARIRLTNQSNTAGVTILADAVRLGGGLGDTSVAGSPISNKPRWEEQARQYAKWVGMPDVDNINDVIVRPIYSEWEKEAGEDAVYISWHTNGYNGYNTTARGTESYIHSFEPTPNSNVLQNFIHTELLNDLHTGWDPAWPDRGKKTQDLGELRLLDSIPGVLIENGYHDNPTDAESLKDPRFNQLSARAVYHGLVRYWNSIDPNVPLVYLPEPPQQVMMRNSGVGQITIGWAPGPIDGGGPLGDTATAYRVYTSTDGFGWSNPIDVASTSYTLTGLLSNQLLFIRVTGVNAGGESFPSPVLAARTAAEGIAPVLIVYGFDRIDRFGDIQQNDPPEGISRRMFIDRINRFDAIIRHAEALTLPFDSAQHATVSDNAIGLGNYTLVDWIAGEEQAPFPSLNANDQTAVTNFLNNGGALFISGAELAYDLRGTAFLANTLRASYLVDDAQTYSANPTGSGIFSGLGAIAFDDGSHGMYDVDYADVINPINGAASALVYNTASAAVQYANGCTRVVYSAVPFETIYPPDASRAVMNRLMDFLGVCLPTNLQTAIVSPGDGTFVNALPAFSGSAGSAATRVEVSVRRASDGLFYTGSSFVSATEVWLIATGTNPWSYALPSLGDGAYALRARMVNLDSQADPTPAAVTFTLDRVAPDTPVIITPTYGVSLIAVAPLLQWDAGGDPSGFTLEIDSQVQVLNSPMLTATRVVTDGPHQWRVRAFDQAANQSGWSTYAAFTSSSLKTYLPLILKSYGEPQPPPAAICSDSISNGGFETGDLAGWTIGAGNPPPQVIATPVYDGAYAVRVGAAGTADAITQRAYSSVQQTVSLPADVMTATVSFERYRYSGDSGDLQYVVVLNGGDSDYLVFDRADDAHWLSGIFDLSAYAGQTITLRFGAYNNGSGGTTGMLIDNVQTQICVPQ